MHPSLHDDSPAGRESPPSAAVGGPRSLLPFYFHLTFFIAAILLGLDTVLSFLRIGGDDLDPIRLGIEGVVAILAVIGGELERNQPGGSRRARALLLGALGVVLVGLTLRTGGLSSPYFVLVATTCLFAGLSLSPGSATYVTALIAVAYVGGLTYVAETSAMPGGGGRRLTALLVHLAFLLLTTSLASRVASRQRKTVATLEVQSMRDPLTSLDNRRSFLTKMESELKRAERFAWPITMLIIDLDHFKRMNDAYGHAMGDRVLVEVAKLLRENVGTIDHIARVGGEEFAVAAVAAEPYHGRDLADRLVRAFRTYPWGCLVPELKVTASVGVAVLPGDHVGGEPEATLAQLMERADKALYKVKQSGRDGYLVAGEEPASIPMR